MNFWLWGTAFAQTSMQGSGGSHAAAAATHAAHAGGHAAQQGGGWMTIAMMVVFIAIFYFLLIRPQQKQRKKQEEFLASLKVGDDVYTTAGIIGKIVGIEQAVVSLKISKDTVIKVLKSQIAGYFKPGEINEADKR